MMNIALFVLSTLTAQADASATYPRELQLKAGFGFSSYEHRPRATSAGFYAEADYVVRITDWFHPKAYAGLLLTGANENSCNGIQPCSVSNRIGFGGVKARFIAPFDYVRPYVEAGGGLSIGTIRTQIGEYNDSPNHHLFGHIAISAGLAVGPHQEVDLGFNFLLHPSRDQSAGGITLGIRIPL